MITKGFGENSNPITQGLGIKGIFVAAWREIIRFTAYIKQTISFDKEL